jgi:hypothetical protein
MASPCHSEPDLLPRRKFNCWRYQTPTVYQGPVLFLKGPESIGAKFAVGGSTTQRLSIDLCSGIQVRRLGEA